MISASRLVIGNAILYAINSNKNEIDLCDFLEYRDELNRRIDRQLPDISACDILEEAHSLSPFLTLRESEPNRRFRILDVNNEKGMRESFIKKLDIYYRSMAPTWLMQEADTMISELIGV